MARLSKIATPALSFSRPFTSSYLRSWRYSNSHFKRCSPTSSHSESSSSLAETRIKFNFIDGVEPIEEYVPGGYHPVDIGDVLQDRYHIVNKLGFGGYSTVWLARDTRLERYVAVKVGIARSESVTLQQEIKALRALSACARLNPGYDSIPRVLDEFTLCGPNGVHEYYTMEPARCNLHDVAFSSLFPIEATRALVGGLALALAFIHSQGYVHGDLHLQNILVKLPSNFHQLSIKQLYDKYGKPEAYTITQYGGKPISSPHIPQKAVVPLCLGKSAYEFDLSDTRLMLSDFGEAFAPASDLRRGQECNTPLAFQAPEARFEPQAPLSYPSDIWSLATAIWEIIGMKAIFSNDWVTEDEMVCQHIDELGPMPQSWWERWEERGQFFDKNGRPIEGRYVWPSLDTAFEEWVQAYRRERKVGEFGREETAAILHLMRRMLAFRPEERPTIEQVLKSEWMVKWVLPDFERSLKA